MTDRDQGPEDIFSLQGFAYTLQSSPTTKTHKGGDDLLTFGVTLTADVTLALDHRVLNCCRCGAFLEPPRTGWARWFAWNKALNQAKGLDGTTCVACMADAYDVEPRFTTHADDRARREAKAQIDATDAVASSDD
jgi:hypothetical protein